jgi:hypothetical protein
MFRCPVVLFEVGASKAHSNFTHLEVVAGNFGFSCDATDFLSLQLCPISAHLALVSGLLDSPLGSADSFHF